MSRSTPPLKQHLLTRSDLARMAVPAGEVLSWLGSVALEQVGSLPGDGAADPVFTVLTPELRADLAARLAAIDKTDVVLTPERVCSFLTRVLHAAAPGISASAGSDGIDGLELKQLLQEAAAATASAATADAVHQIAREEAHAEGLAPEPSAPDADAAEEADGVAEPDALDACFDLADLEAVIGGGSADEDASQPPAEPPEQHAPGDEPAMTEEPAPIEVEHVSDLVATDAAEPAVVAATPIATPAEQSDIAEPISEPVAESVAERTVEPTVEPPVESTAEPIDERAAEPAEEFAAAEPEPVRELAAAVPATTAERDENGSDDWTPIERVEGFLVLLKDAVLELAQRPTPQQFDMRPFVLAMQAGLDRSTQQAEVTATAMETLQARVDGLGHRLDEVAARPEPAPVSFAPPRGAAAVVPEADPATTLMAGVAVLALAWSVLFWTTLDAPHLAVGTLVGANVIGCVLLAAWWRR